MKKPKRIKNIGMAYALAWTPSGTNLIQIEARAAKASNDRGNLFVDGDIGDDVLQSIHTVCNLLMHESDFDITKKDMILTIPGPLDGPSAALAIYLALYSAIAKKPINQRLAFTGALSAEGAILPVGDIQNKLIAVYRAKLEGLVLPMDNLQDLPGNHPDDMKWGNILICPVVRVIDALALAIP